MPVTRTRPLDGVPDLYDGIAGFGALLVLAWAFLYAFQPILGVLIALAFLSVYAVTRTADYEHVVIVTGLWLLVFIGFNSLGLLGVFLGGILALVAYSLWRRT